MKSGLMRLDVIRGKRTYFGNAVEMKTFCIHSVGKLESKMGQLLVCPVFVKNSVTNSAAISDDESVVSSVCSQHAEPVGQ
jgi:hypothetical protein